MASTGETGLADARFLLGLGAFSTSSDAFFSPESASVSDWDGFSWVFLRPRGFFTFSGSVWGGSSFGDSSPNAFPEESSPPAESVSVWEDIFSSGSEGGFPSFVSISVWESGSSSGLGSVNSSEGAPSRESSGSVWDGSASGESFSGWGISASSGFTSVWRTASCRISSSGSVSCFLVAIVRTSCKFKIQPAVLPSCKDFFCVPAFSPALSLGQVR